jgi:PilZ domain
MSLKSLVLCSDEKIVRVLRRVLGDLDIEMDLCANSDGALRKLTRNRFEAIVADCGDEGAFDVLRSARSAPCNKHAVAVAIVEPVVALKAVFDIGAHFVLYKPVMIERAKTSFRAARALMKSERRRNVRIAVQIPVVLRSPDGERNMQVNTLDLSEGGMAVAIPHHHRPRGHWNISFTLPGTESPLEIPAEFAWEGSKKQAGLRFGQASSDAMGKLKDWLKQNSPDAEQDDPPIRCQLTDLSLGGCYLEIPSPFPASSRVTLSMRAAEVEVRTSVEKFLGVLTGNRTLSPELLVEPDGLETVSTAKALPADADDPLLQLFYGESLTPEQFHEALRNQRATPTAAGTHA